MTKNILYYCPVTYFKGGAERSLFDLVKNESVYPVLLLPGKGEISRYAESIGVKVVYIDHRSIDDVERPVKISSLIRAASDTFLVQKELRSICKDLKIDIVHSNGMKAHVINVLACLWTKVNSLIHIRDIPNTRIEKILWSIIFNLSSYVVLVSAACRVEMINNEKCFVVHNGVDVQNNEWCVFSKENITIGFVGRIHPDKGVCWLIKAVKKSVEYGINVKLIIRGDFKPNDIPYHKYLIGLVESLGLNSNVIFEGFISDPKTLYNNLNLVCVPSIKPDPFPRAVMESFARGIPVIAFDSGGISEMIDDGVNGYIIDKSEESLKDTLILIIKEQIDLGNISENCYKYASENLTVANLHSSISDIYGSRE